MTSSAASTNTSSEVSLLQKEREAASSIHRDLLCLCWSNCLNPTKVEYDPCCGSGGMFVQSEGFVEGHGGRRGDIAIYGQDSNYTTWRLCKMKLAVRCIDADIRWNNEGSFHKDELKDKRFDLIMVNPPFNVSDWGGERSREEPRWKHGVPSATNANYGWLQHILWHLAPEGTVGVVLANGSMSSTQSGEDSIYELAKVIGHSNIKMTDR